VGGGGGGGWSSGGMSAAASETERRKTKFYTEKWFFRRGKKDRPEKPFRFLEFILRLGAWWALGSLGFLHSSSGNQLARGLLQYLDT
jgi:hypothetical protein